MGFAFYVTQLHFDPSIFFLQLAVGGEWLEFLKGGARTIRLQDHPQLHSLRSAWAISDLFQSKNWTLKWKQKPVLHSSFSVCSLFSPRAFWTIPHFHQAGFLFLSALDLLGLSWGQLVAIRQFRFSLSQTLNKPSINHALKKKKEWIKLTQPTNFPILIYKLTSQD